MELSTLVSELCSDVRRDHGLNKEDAERLFTAMLEADLAPFEMGAVLMAYRFKGESAAEQPSNAPRDRLLSPRHVPKTD